MVVRGPGRLECGRICTEHVHAMYMYMYKARAIGRQGGKAERALADSIFPGKSRMPPSATKKAAKRPRDEVFADSDAGPSSSSSVDNGDEVRAAKPQPRWAACGVGAGQRVKQSTLSVLVLALCSHAL